MKKKAFAVIITNILMMCIMVSFVGCGGEKINIEETDIYTALKAYETEPDPLYISTGKIEEPYVIVRKAREENSYGEIDPDEYEIVGCSNGDISKEHISEAKTIVVCNSYYDMAKYSNGDTGDSEYIYIVCVDATTGGIYLSKDDSESFADLESKPLPGVASSVPHYRYSNSDIKHYVKNNFDNWKY